MTAVLTISDEDVPGAIGFSTSAYTVLESAGLALITVTRTGTAGAVTVDFTTADGSAIAPVDYTAVSGTLSFGGGETTKTVAIPILEDGLREGNETIRLDPLQPDGRGHAERDDESGRPHHHRQRDGPRRAVQRRRLLGGRERGERHGHDHHHADRQHGGG